MMLVVTAVYFWLVQRRLKPCGVGRDDERDRPRCDCRAPVAGSASRWTVERIGVHAVLLLFVAIALGPIFVVIMNSFKTTPAIFGGPFALPNERNLQPRRLPARLHPRQYPHQLPQQPVRHRDVGRADGGACRRSRPSRWSSTRARWRRSSRGLFVVGVMLPIRLGTIPIIEIMIGLAAHGYALGADPRLHGDEHPARRHADDDLLPHGARRSSRRPRGSTARASCATFRSSCRWCGPASRRSRR